MSPEMRHQENQFKVKWVRIDNYNEVVCMSAHHAAIMLCDNHALLRIVKVGGRANYVFYYGQFQHFPRFDSDFAVIKGRVSVKKYFDTYRSLLNGDIELHAAGGRKAGN